MSLVVFVLMAGMRMAMSVAAMTAATEQEHARDVDNESQHRNRNGLVEVDRNRPDQAGDGFVADEDRDHGQHDGAGEAGQISQLAGAEAETIVFGVTARVAVGQRCEQKRARVRRHMQTVGDERDRAKDQAADDLGDHHEGTERDHHPGAALVLLVTLAEKNVRVGAR